MLIHLIHSRMHNACTCGGASARTSARDGSSWRAGYLGQPKRGVRKPTVWSFSSISFCKKMPSCLGQWSATCSWQLREIEGNHKPEVYYPPFWFYRASLYIYIYIYMDLIYIYIYIYMDIVVYIMLYCIIL